MPSSLLKKQQFFTLAVAKLINRIDDAGYSVTFGDAYRSPEMAAIYATQGKGIKNSLHTQRLAIDLMLFWEERYLDKSEDYKDFGEYWKRLSTPDFHCCWGGDFSRPDGNHFSIEHGGVK